MEDDNNFREAYNKLFGVKLDDGETTDVPVKDDTVKTLIPSVKNKKQKNIRLRLDDFFEERRLRAELAKYD